MSVEFPTELTVVCDDCGTTEEVPATTFAGNPESVGVETGDLPEGWVQEGNGTHYCPDCNPDKDEEN